MPTNEIETRTFSKKNPAPGRSRVKCFEPIAKGPSTPGALLMAIVFGALAALVLRDFTTTFLAEITHGLEEKEESTRK